jgi:hypothetical protein
LPQLINTIQDVHPNPFRKGSWMLSHLINTNTLRSPNLPRPERENQDTKKRTGKPMKQQLKIKSFNKHA